MSNTLFKYFKKLDTGNSPASPSPSATSSVPKNDTPAKITPLKSKEEVAMSNKKQLGKENVTTPGNKFKMSDKENTQATKVMSKMEVEEVDDDEIVRPIAKTMQVIFFSLSKVIIIFDKGT